MWPHLRVIECPLVLDMITLTFCKWKLYMQSRIYFLFIPHSHPFQIILLENLSEAVCALLPVWAVCVYASESWSYMAVLGPFVQASPVFLSSDGERPGSYAEERIIRKSLSD